ncbi:unnamed protein product [Rotaria socialis]|uniref:Saposin B-type domain-containing protein n=1 Tax=Rotaria socialis TaxID=392032 RepID=A0A820XSV9_9BILA|nr:unnamed protein product [Rotaria socialis]CAF3451571.1 unnamed protein product [Rotaria socialis]CAF4164567.1 unnamed protein product [Rotaria socialis]CAF4537169.1 unnamed protein product [Rotaria socialis]
MYKLLSIILLVVVVAVGFSNATRSFNTPSKNVERLTTDDREKNVDLDLCPMCINEAVAAINVILNAILDEGILADCNKLCSIVANKSSSFIGTMCDLACDALGIDEFIHFIIAADPDPIWYCEIARLCPINDNGDAKFVKFSVLPSTGPQGTTFVIDCSFKSLNGTGTSMLRLDITDPTNETDSNDFLIEAKKPGTYSEKIGLKTLTALNCDPTKRICDSFLVGTYNVTAQFCNGECDSHHPHSGNYDLGKASFTVTKKK